MRLLIYLLALVSGFSAAEAARAEVSHASSVAQTAVAAAEALASQDQQATPRSVDHRPGTIAVSVTPDAPLTLVVPTPISRHDTTHE